MKNDTIFNYILSEENAFKTDRVPVGEGWEWSFAEHIKRSMLMKNSQYEGGNLGDRPFKNIVRPILNVAYRAEGIDVKDIDPYVDNSDDYYLSFLVRKFHDRFSAKYNLTGYIDDLVESYVDYGVTISKRVNGKCPETVPLARIAFCDQTDINGGPLCEKHAYGIDQLLEKKGIWNDDEIDQAINQARAEKTNDQAAGGEGRTQRTPGKYIEVYELHGMLPERYLRGDNEGFEDTGKYVYQMQIVCFYKNDKGEKIGLSLFKGLEKQTIYKVLVRDKIFGRCAGFGGIEELFESQVWINYSTIQIKEMLDIAALMLMQTADKAFKTRNNVTSMEKGQILVHEDGNPLTQIDLQPLNLEAFLNDKNDWLDVARTTGSANDAVLGEKPDSGTPFDLQNFVAQQNYSLHDWRQGKIANFLGEIYREWILPELVSEMNDGQQFSSIVSLDELNEVADAVVTNEVNKIIKDKVFSGEVVSDAERQAITSAFRDKFINGAPKRFHEIMEGQFKLIPIEVTMNIAGKQKNLALLSQKLSNVVSQVIANPQALQNPAVAKIVNMLLEASALDPIDFASLTKAAPAPQFQQLPANPNAAPAVAGKGGAIPSNISPTVATAAQ